MDQHIVLANQAIDFLREGIARIKEARRLAMTLPDASGHKSLGSPEEGRRLSVAITEAETALLWLRSVRPNEMT